MHALPLMVIALLVLAACSHDSKRANLLDPALTPGVDLSVVVLDSSGTAQLTWTAADGGFDRYLVLRNASRSSVVDTVASITDVATTSYTDTVTSDVDWVYRVSVVNSAGLETPSAEIRPRPLSLPRVLLRALRFDSATGSAQLEWGAYSGPRFRNYRIWKHTQGQSPAVVAELVDRNATAWVDTGLAGAREYFYQVDVVTTLDEVAAGTEQGGQFHELLATWPLEADVDDRVRLHAVGDTILAVIASTDGIQLLRNNRAGSRLGDNISWSVNDLDPNSVSLAQSEGTTYVTGRSDGSVGDIGPPLIYATRADTVVYTTVIEAYYPRRVGLFSGVQPSAQSYTETVTVPWPTEATVSGQNTTLFRSDFSEELLSEDWTALDLRDLGSNRFTRRGDSWRATEAFLDFSVRMFPRSASAGARLELLDFVDRTDDAGQVLAALVDTSPTGGLFFMTDRDGARQEDFELTEPLVPGDLQRLTISLRDGLRMSVQRASLWRGSLDEEARRMSLWAVGDGFLLASGSLHLFDQANGASADVEYVRQLAAPGYVADVRSWSRVHSTGRFSQRIGMVLADQSRVTIHDMRIRVGRPEFQADNPEVELGERPGAGNGQFIVPLEMAVGPDERIYVLDAGNFRVQVIRPRRNLRHAVRSSGFNQRRI